MFRNTFLPYIGLAPGYIANHKNIFNPLSSFLKATCPVYVCVVCVCGGGGGGVFIWVTGLSYSHVCVLDVMKTQLIRINLLISFRMMSLQLGNICQREIFSAWF